MNQSQLKYARERAEQIKRARLSALREATAPKVTLTRAQKLKAVAEGRIRVDLKSKGPDYAWADGIKFDDEVPGMSSAEYDSKVAAVEKDYRKLIDELVLGDNEAALLLLKAFEAA